MLRRIVIGLAALAVAAALIAVAFDPYSFPFPAMTMLVLAGCLFEQRLRSPSIPAAGARATEERFVDPETGRVMQVWFDPETGLRSYVDAGMPPGPSP